MQAKVKKQVERMIMEYFRKLYPEFPAGKLIPHESPDFLIAINPKIDIGIEITTLVPNTGGNTGNFTVQNSAGILFLNQVRQTFESGPDQSLWVKMLFSGEREPEETRMLSRISMTTAVIRKNINSTGSNFFTISVPANELPSFIDAIWIAGNGDTAGQIWEMAHKPGKGFDLINALQQTILRKEEKLAFYRSVKTREMWLLITLDTLQAGGGNHLINRIHNSVFHSTYNRIFILEIMNARIFRIV